ncbi:MAG TPA: TonB-dependent receptor, partial [Gemmatimonadales bacterium]|nr:TonB-dependent receptor [Gemmatimonadales bacterium]
APDARPQYFAGDPRNDDPPQVHQRFGEPDATSFAGLLSAAKPVRGRIEAYGVAGYSVRRSVAADRWRTPSDDRTVRALFPDGLLPLIAPTLQDGSATAGLRGRLAGWGWDASVGYARSTVHYTLEQTNNPSLGSEGPTRFDAGTLRSDAFSTELHAGGRLRPGFIPPLSVELGAEQRDEGYQIEAGEPDSYRFGAVPVLDGPHAGQLAPIGAQGFTAFRPGNAVIRRRGMLGTSGALSSVLFRRLTLGAAAGLEYYRSLGATLVYTLRGELAPLDGVALRGSWGTGARVPPLSQSWYSTTATNLTGLIGLEDRTVPAADQVGVLLGARRLQPERSTDLELGGSVTRFKGVTLRADYYRIRVEHRVILSGTFKDPAVGSFLSQQGFPGIAAVRFFTNALTTRTSGIDARASYRFRWREVGVEAAAGWSHHVTHAVLSDSVPGLLAPFTSVLFDRTERARYELGQPEDNLIVTGLAERRRWSLWARAQRAGAVSRFGPAADGSLDQRYGARWLADLALGYVPRPRLRVTLGAENLLGTTPDRNRFGNAGVEGNSYFGTLPYPGISPFGFAGRRLFLRASWQ